MHCSLQSVLLLEILSFLFSREILVSGSGYSETDFFMFLLFLTINVNCILLIIFYDEDTGLCDWETQKL